MVCDSRCGILYFAGVKLAVDAWQALRVSGVAALSLHELDATCDVAVWGGVEVGSQWRHVEVMAVCAEWLPYPHLVNKKLLQHSGSVG